MSADPKPITEKDGIHPEWYAEAKEQTVETLPAFMDRLATAYRHDYGTICHAIAASAIAAAWAMERTPQGGITGFQAGAIMWEFIQHWNYSSNRCGLRLVDYDKLLYPQYADHFEKTINASTMALLQAEANKLLKEKENSKFVVPGVVEHWRSIAAGNPPFGFRVIPD